MTITLPRSHSAVAGLAAALTLAACAPAGPPAGSPSTAPRPTATPAPVRALQACFGTAPAGWAGTQRAALPTTSFDPNVVAPSGDRVYGSYQTTAGERGTAAMDLTSGALTRLLPTFAQELAVAPPWLAWVQPTGQINPGPWTLFARNLDTGEQLTLATSRLPGGADGLPEPGGLALRGTELAWAQPTSIDLTARAAELRVYDLAAHRQQVLDSGNVGAPVLAGSYLVWTHAGGDGQTVLQAVDATTLLPAALPARLRAQTGIGALAGSPAYLVWSTDAHHGSAWRIDRDQLTTYTVDEQHRLQYVTVAGHFLLWSTYHPTALVMDLDTGGGYETEGRIAGSEAAIVRATPLGPTNPKAGAAGTTVSVLASPGALAIPGCGR